MAADESIRWCPESKGKSEKVIKETTCCGVENISEHDVHGVFGSNRAGAEHGKAELHRKHEVSREKKVSGVNGECGVGEFVGDGGKLVADEVSGGGCVCGVLAKKTCKLLRRAGR
ncbi:hypothetical protein O6P43_003120 [Quillaja saponaria]|uniref:Uncharacterized protein n=1 Tax=Quillaja saponaria TaxID=32244 RepID=A0AAD7QF79_QUISA|nr:hypothetical protein O6P43_003120 [Quillaja saponaria]